MTKLTIGIVIAGLLLIAATVRSVPTPEDHYTNLTFVLDTIIDLQTKTTLLINEGNYWQACETQKQVTQLAIKNQISKVGIDMENLIKLEALICTYAQTDTI